MLPTRNHKLIGFSSKDKIQQHHGDGTQTIICMGRPFRVEGRIKSMKLVNSRRRRTKIDNEGNSFVYLVENSCRLQEFPMYLVLKRAFYNIDQIMEAHREIGILSNIKDKNIVRVFHSEISRSEGKISVTIAMEYCHNNLARRIASGAANGAGIRLSEAEICHMLFAITSALGYLHSLQPPIAHRNITPENILINNNLAGPFAYMLTNFSSASTKAYQCANREEANLVIEDIEQHTKPAFRPPEMVDPWSKRRICEKVDLWMLGVLLYYVLYNRLPFEATGIVLGREPRLSFPALTSATAAYSGSFRTILDHLLDPDPSSRWDVFALTNFLRYDEDLSRHLGTFCFTQTEAPAEWVEQDVHVVGRAALAKAPVMRYDDPSPGSLHCGSTNHTNDGNDDDNNNNTNNDKEEDTLREVLLATAGVALSKEEIAQYREMVIKEQEEAWVRAKAAVGAEKEEEKEEKQQTPPPSAQNTIEDLFMGVAPPLASGAASKCHVPPPSAPLPMDPFGVDGIVSAPSCPQEDVNALFPHPEPVCTSRSGFPSLAHPIGGGYGPYDGAGQPPTAGMQSGPAQEPSIGGMFSNHYTNPIPSFDAFNAVGGPFFSSPQQPTQSLPPTSSTTPQIHMDFISPPAPNPRQPMGTTNKQPSNPPQKK